MIARNNNATSKHSGLKAATLFLSLLGFFVVLAAASSFYSPTASSDSYHLSPFMTLILSGLALGKVYAILIALVTSASEEEQDKQINTAFLLYCSGFFLILLELSTYYLFKVSQSFLNLSFSLLTVVYLYAVTKTLYYYRRFNEQDANRASIIICLIGSACFGSVYYYNQLASYHDLKLYMSIFCHSLIGIHAGFVWIAAYFTPTFNGQRNTDNLSKDSRLHFSSKLVRVRYLTITLSSCALAIISLYHYYEMRFANVELDESIPFLCLGLAFIPSLNHVLELLRVEHQLQIQNNSLVSLVSDQARKFMLRYAHGDGHFATTIGLRTANFMIDHDPKETIRNLLPSYMVRIRQTQIQSLVDSILHDKTIDRRIVSNQIYGAIDPESSIRPCLDVILMFTAVYLDAMTIVESRLKNLSRLLPILDPELSNRIDGEVVEKGFSKIQWFFHIDFDWFDQHITRRGDKASFEVNIDNLRLRERQKIISILEKHNLMGNFIWISETARERIMLEAPYLGNIVEAWPLNLDEGDEKDGVIFLIKFEHLIPRLQQYFNLEATRDSLKFFPPSEDAQKILVSLRAELDSLDNYKSLLKSIEIIRHYPWRGFKEKDAALDLLVDTYDKVSKLCKKSTDHQKLTKSFVAATSAVGYPSQAIHEAHLEKLRIRSPNFLASAIANPHQKYFLESWLHLSSTSTKQFSREDIVNLMNVIGSFCRSRNSKKLSPNLTAKVVESFLNLAQQLTSEDVDLIQEICNRVLSVLIENNASTELFCFLIDGKIFLESNLKEDIAVNDDNMNKLQSFIKQQLINYGDQSSVYHSLAIRWRIIAAQKRPNSYKAS